MTDFFDNIAIIITEGPFAIGTAILLVVIHAVCYIAASYVILLRLMKED